MIKKIAAFIRDVLPYDATKIIVSKSNTTLKPLTDTYFIIDTLSTVPFGNREEWNPTTEKMNLYARCKSTVTIDAIGANAESLAYTLLNMIKSAKAVGLQNDFIIHRVSKVNRIPSIDSEYIPRFQLEIVVYHEIETIEDVNRIDIIQDVVTIVDYGSDFNLKIEE